MREIWIFGLLGIVVGIAVGDAEEPIPREWEKLVAEANQYSPPEIRLIDPETQGDGFFGQETTIFGIRIAAHRCVAERAMIEAQYRIRRMLILLPAERERMRQAGVEFHIIGRDQGTSDLPYLRVFKTQPFMSNGEATNIDERTRGVGGLHSSCGEENLLKLENDHYYQRDICTHEFAHALFGFGFTDAQRAIVKKRYQEALAQGKWTDLYAAVNEDEFFAELSMWYHGMRGEQRSVPENTPIGSGPETLWRYDPESFRMIDSLYRGNFSRPDSTELTNRVH